MRHLVHPTPLTAGDGRAAVDIQKGEFLCPLCKRLSNTLVPQMCVSADERELAEPEVFVALAPKQAVKAVRCLLLLVSKRRPVRTTLAG